MRWEVGSWRVGLGLRSPFTLANGPMDQVVLGLSLTTVEKDPRLLVLALTYYVRAKLDMLTNYM
jgi:hypothetical protein